MYTSFLMLLIQYNIILFPYSKEPGKKTRQARPEEAHACLLRFCLVLKNIYQGIDPALNFYAPNGKKTFT